MVRSLTLAELTEVSARDKRSLERALPNATLMVDARLAGLSKDGLLDDKASETPVTIESPAWLDGLTGPPSTGLPLISWRLRAVSAALEVDPHADSDWIESLRLPWRQAAGSEDVVEWLLIERHRGVAAQAEEGRSGGRAQTLAEHSTWTASEAARIAANLDLPEKLRAVLVTAARLHDEGKRAARWQHAFSALRQGGPWAKTRGPVRPAILDGYRHELGSLPLAERDEGFLALPPEDQDLALHLIAAHHGHARPLIPWQGCDDAPPSRTKSRAEAVARRFVELEARWGPWRLAWLESLLRAADQAASRRNDEGAA
ncbi:MAG TPA: HD domain-containing protein [Myxococcota bacterium]|nr:HD domain-containing protein [Myxococcota bacterium]